MPNGSKENCWLCLGKRETDSLPSKTEGGTWPGIGMNWETPQLYLFSDPPMQAPYSGVLKPRHSEPQVPELTGCRQRQKHKHRCEPHLFSSQRCHFWHPYLWTWCFLGENSRCFSWEETFSHSTTKWLSPCPLKSLWNRQKKSSSLQGEPRHKISKDQDWEKRKKEKKKWQKWKWSGEIQGQSSRRGCLQDQERAGSQSSLSRDDLAEIHRLLRLWVANSSLFAYGESEAQRSREGHALTLGYKSDHVLCAKCILCMISFNPYKSKTEAEFPSWLSG